MVTPTQASASSAGVGIAPPNPTTHPVAGFDTSLDLLSKMLDEVDYGMLLVDRDRAVLLHNQAAINILTADHPLWLCAERLSARRERDLASLCAALEEALLRGKRSMLYLGQAATGASVSVIPMVVPERAVTAVLVVLGRLTVVSTLAVHSLARLHGLSPSEGQVLGRLCAGYSPQEIAQQNGVKLETVRSQISQVRVKTGVGSIRELIRHAACLPPMVGLMLQRAPQKSAQASMLA